jgi:hypothetical protein
MHRLLERLDDATTTIVPLLYLGGLALGTMAYFAGVTLDAGLAVGVALATAAELHSFLEQRRVRLLWARLARASTVDPQRDGLISALRAHVAILAALVAFSTYNSVAFVVATWHPTPGFVPGWLQVGVRGAVIPGFFLLTGALAPLAADPGDDLARASRAMLAKAIGATVRQWNARIDRARKRGFDLAPVAVALMMDAGDANGARRIRLIAQGLAAAEGNSQHLVALESADARQSGETTDNPSASANEPSGGKQMQDELSPRTAAALLRYLLGLHGDTLDALDPTTPLWPSLARNAVQGENGISVQAIADLCAKRMGTSKIHTLRHTFAHAMESAGAKVSDIQARLGHASLATTGRYLTALKRASNPYAERLEELFGVE